MKKSDRNLLQERLHKLAQPSAKAEPAPDATDEISHLFGGNLQLPGPPESSGGRAKDAAGGLSPSDGLSPSGGQTPPISLPIAPERDFNRRANSLEKIALPSGLFPGSSKRLYDALYVRTRGAHTPTRSIRATKRELTEWSGVKNRKTIDAHLRHLTTSGLLVRTWTLGDVDGYTYEVRLPEELEAGDRGGQRGVSPPEGSDQRSDRGTDQKRVTGGQSQPADNSTVSGDRKTSFKTKEEKFDDEAFAGLVDTFQQITTELTGKAPTAADDAKWRELAEMLVAELRIAAGRTTVSNVPAFMAEHLRRRLWKMDKKQAAREGKELPDQTAPAEQKNPVDCPDCNGSGWWYPNGTEKGVAKCKHARLNVPSTSGE